MLIYNYQKEFLGIDEADLKALGFSNLLQLRSESADFADLFVKTPGYVHNFKHVHWIDFIACAQSSEDSKVIIHAKNKNYRATIHINTAYLIDNPSQKAYFITLANLRELSSIENGQIAHAIQEKPAPKTTTAKTALFANQNLEELPTNPQDEIIEIESFGAVAQDPYEFEDKSVIIDTFDTSTTEVIEDEYDDEIFLEEKPKIQEREVPQEINTSTSNNFADEDIKLDLDMDDLDFEETIPQESATKIKESTVQKESIVEKTPLPSSSSDANFENEYIYNPKVASDELGLPIDLIEEFIGDFIAQAAEFKEEIYTSLTNGDMENVKVLSHKLKGVAANLRVEDAFEVLSIVNTSSNYDEIKINLDRFYKIIAKLSGESIENTPVSPPQISQTETKEEEVIDTDDFEISFKVEDEPVAVAPTLEESYMDNTPYEEPKPVQDEEDFEINEELLQIDEDIDLFEPDEVLKREEVEEVDFSEEKEELLEAEPEIEIDLMEADEEELELSYDKDSAAHEIGIDKESFDELFKDYLSETSLLVEEVEKSIEQNNFGMWKESAIQIKSMSNNMRINDFNQELESLIDTKDAGVAKKAIDKIIITLKQISNL